MIFLFFLFIYVSQILIVDITCHFYFGDLHFRQIHATTQELYTFSKTWPAPFIQGQHTVRFKYPVRHHDLEFEPFNYPALIFTFRRSFHFHPITLPNFVGEIHTIFGDGDHMASGSFSEGQVYIEVVGTPDQIEVLQYIDLIYRRSRLHGGHS